MSIEVHLIGFGEHRPACFDKNNRFSCQTTEPVSPRQLLEKAGFGEEHGLIFMQGDTIIPEDQWDQAQVLNGSRVTLMSAIEGG